MWLSELWPQQLVGALVSARMCGAEVGVWFGQCWKSLAISSTSNVRCQRLQAINHQYFPGGGALPGVFLLQDVRCGMMAGA